MQQLLYNFKKSLLLSSTLGLLLLGACQDETMTGHEAITGQSIGLTTTVMPPPAATRGTPISMASELTTMGVFCYHTGFNNWATAETNATPNKMNNLSWTQTGEVWSTASPVSWGSDVSIAEKFTFFGYAPYATGTGATGNGLTVSSTTGTPKLTYTVPTDITKQPDLLIATAKDIHPTTGKIPLAYKHALTCIAFKAKGTGQTITSVKVKGVSSSGTLSLDASGTPIWSNLSSPGTIEYTAGLNSTTGIVTTSTPSSILAADGYLMMIPQTLTANAQLIVTVDGAPQTFNLNAQDITSWTAGQMLTYTIETKPPSLIVDYTTKKLANSYIINPNSSYDMIYRFPVRRANEFWADPDNTYGSNDPNYALGATDTWSMKLRWCTSTIMSSTPSTQKIYLSKSTGTGPDDYFEVTIPKGYPFSNNEYNLFIELHKTTGGGYSSWSYHLWVTTYNPYVTGTPLENARDDNQPWVWDVPGGKLFRMADPIPNFNTSYGNSTNGLNNPWSTKYVGKRIMDRPIGGKSGYTLCYQYGRKDPFPSYGYTLQHGYYYLYLYDDKTTVMQRWGTYSLAYVVQKTDVQWGDVTWNYSTNPVSIKSVSNWCGTTTNNINTSTAFLWNDPKVLVGSGGKSIFDPSPYGFRLPENGTFKALYSSTGQYITNTSKFENYPPRLMYSRSPTATPYNYFLEFPECNQIRPGVYSEYNQMGYKGIAFCTSSPADIDNRYGMVGQTGNNSSLLFNKSGAYTAYCIEDEPEP